MIFTDEFILGAFLCGTIALMGYKFGSMPLRVISSLGWICLSFVSYQASEDLLSLALMWLLAFAQVLVGRSSS